MSRPAPDKTLATLDRCATVAGGWAERLHELDVDGIAGDVVAKAAAHLDNADAILTAFYLRATGVVIPGTANVNHGLHAPQVTGGGRQREIDRLRAARIRTAARLRFCRLQIQRLSNARRCPCGPPAHAEFPESLFNPPLL